MALPIDNRSDGLADSNSRISGNLSPEIKRQLETVVYDVMGKPNVFGSSIMKRIVLTEASIVPKAEEPSRSEVRVVCEVTVVDGMLNGTGKLHGGCAAFLIDACVVQPLSLVRCSTLVFIAASRGPGVSTTLDFVYHAPASPGAKLRIVNTAIAVGARIMSSRSEIWDDTSKRLCVTGIHVKMEPSAPKITQKQKL
ncbi:hypothetical protein BJV74DRAFT_878989 [Russula compacta]|nr:hypothetical protein BJV74DRAFT_878989 [Russula compacta]